MIYYIKGSLFESKADALAHGCNTVGKMSAGIAKEFRNYFPQMYKDYQRKCAQGLFLPGQGYIFKNPKKPHIINLATQKDSGAKIEYVDSAFKWLAKSYRDMGIKSVAMPKIASGLGGLEWSIVNSALKKYFDDSELNIEVWELSSD